jgi:hypothetical protein
MLGTYSPELKNTRISYSWLGVGREFPFKFSKARGKGRVILRRIESDDYRGGSVVGQVIGENYSGTGADSYTGMMRIMSSRAPEGVVVGRGWTVDAQADFSAGERIKGMVTCEGLAGYVSWHGLNVQDTFITSMGVFEDPEGYLHDFGGISGAEWREDVKLDLAARYRLDMLYMHEPSLMLGIAYREGDGASVSTGAAWTHSKSLIPYFRWHISDQALELGAVGRKLQLRILSDDWLFTSPEHMEVNLTATALTF